MEEVVEEKNEEQVDSFGRLMVRKVAVLEKKRRSKNIEGLLGRERNRRKRINNWCCKLGLPVFLEGHSEEHSNNENRNREYDNDDNKTKIKIENGTKDPTSVSHQDSHQDSHNISLSFERALLLSQLELDTIGDEIDLEDSDLKGEMRGEGDIVHHTFHSIICLLLILSFNLLFIPLSTQH